MANEEIEDTPINAEPTKGFFVDMITRDISLEQAVLDLVDNSVDGAKLHRGDGDRPLEGFEVSISISGVRFRIVDNCGGFSRETARDYAFRFGRPPGREKLEYSLGRFGIGMKRALFKFGDHFTVESSTDADAWGIDIDVPIWQDDPGWTFPWAEVSAAAAVSADKPGTDITVDRLKPEVAARFGTPQFATAIENVIKAKHRQFISEGLAISVNGRHLVATSLSLLIADRLQPGVDTFTFEAEGEDPVHVRIVVGIGESVPNAAGWYVVCNGRVILEADRSKETGWGLVEEENDEILIPKFHNQFARFRGIVTFDSADAARVPWNTMKDDVDRESAVWQQTFVRMIEMMRPVVDFLNQLDANITEYTREGSVLLKYVANAGRINNEQIRQKHTFVAPKAQDIQAPGPRWVSIQYSRPLPDIDFLQRTLRVGSAKAVGERTFDLALSKQRGE